VKKLEDAVDMRNASSLQLGTQFLWERRMGEKSMPLTLRKVGSQRGLLKKLETQIGEG